MGQIEAPLLVRPYLARMTRYELLLVMTAGMATIAGSVMVIYSAMLGEQIRGVLGQLITKSIMSVPAAILFAHVMLPEDNESSQELEKPPRVYEGSMDAITRGAAPAEIAGSISSPSSSWLSRWWRCSTHHQLHHIGGAS